MDQGKLIEIRTHGQTFNNSPNEKFLLMILGSQAKLENDNRGINVIRGLHNKAANGWRPGVAPVGYLNNGLGEEKIIVDPDRSTTIIEMFERVAKSAWTGRDIKRLRCTSILTFYQANSSILMYVRNKYRSFI